MSQDFLHRRMRLAALVSGLHEDTNIGTRELAALQGTTVGTIHQLRAKHPERLPPTSGIGGRRLRWHLGTVQKWLREHATATTNAATASDATTAPDATATASAGSPQKRIGRPRRA